MLDATQALTVLAEIAPARRALLVQRLAAIAADLDGNLVFRPRALPDTHFTRLVILDDPRGELPALLCWESNHDGRERDYLARVARAAPAIEAVWECCVDYPRGAIHDVDRWVSWMSHRAHRAGAFYANYRGVPRATVANDRRVHDAIRDVVDGADRAALCGLPRAEIQRRIREQVAARHPDLDLSSTGEEELRWAAGKVLAVLGALVALPFALVAALPWYAILRRKESRDIATAYARPVDIDPVIRDAEDHFAQNQLTHVVDIKPGLFRLVTLRLVLALVDVVARVYSVRGDLAGITTIHFARWVIVTDPRRRHDRRADLDGDGDPDGRDRPARHRLVFFSNYDGSWEGYLGEFIDRAAPWLTAVWSNTVGFPATEHLVHGGARDEAAFKQWTREHQIATQVWWSEMPDATAQNVRDDTWIRRRIDRSLADHELVAWMRKL